MTQTDNYTTFRADLPR